MCKVTLNTKDELPVWSHGTPRVPCGARHGLSWLGSRIPDDGLQMHFEEKRVFYWMSRGNGGLNKIN